MASFGDIVFASSVDLDVVRICDLSPWPLPPADAGTRSTLPEPASGEFFRNGLTGPEVDGFGAEERAALAACTLSETKLRNGDNWAGFVGAVDTEIDGRCVENGL